MNHQLTGKRVRQQPRSICTCRRLDRTNRSGTAERLTATTKTVTTNLRKKKNKRTKNIELNLRAHNERTGRLSLVERSVKKRLCIFYYDYKYTTLRLSLSL